MRPLPMTITFFIALWLEDVLKNAEIAAKFFRNNGCLRGWADSSFEATHCKREAMFPVTHNSMNGRGKIREGLETNGQCPFLAQQCSQGKSIFLTKNQTKRKKKHVLRYMTRIRLTATNRNRYQNAVLRVLLSASVIWYSDIWRACGLFDQSQAHSTHHVWQNKHSFISFVSFS